MIINVFVLFLFIFLIQHLSSNQYLCVLSVCSKSQFFLASILSISSLFFILLICHSSPSSFLPFLFTFVPYFSFPLPLSTIPFRFSPHSHPPPSSQSSTSRSEFWSQPFQKFLSGCSWTGRGEGVGEQWTWKRALVGWAEVRGGWGERGRGDKMWRSERTLMEMVVDKDADEK